MDIRRFGEFAILAQSRTFLEAADLLFMSQSTLSKHIMAMERELGCTLFDRAQRQVTLTEQGRTLLPYAQKIAALEHRYTAALTDANDQPLETITVGSLPIMAPYGITDAIVDFQRSNPSYSVQLVEGESVSLKQRLLRDEIELAFIRDDGHSEPQFKKIPYTEDRVIAVLPASHPLALRRETIDLSDLSDENFLLLPNGSFVNTLARECCEQAGFTPRVTFTGKRAENIISLIARDAGVSLLMRKPALSLANDRVVVRDITPTATSKVKIYLRRNRAHSQAVVSFIGYLPIRQFVHSAGETDR